MNNNRQTSRRRGRNNNNRSQNNNRSGFDYQNRIDNRARGNASQMLEKYKKLASDAQHNDDRVNAEYYLQFADHYFRVLADFRGRQEAKQEEQQGRRNDREPNRDGNQDDDSGHNNYGQNNDGDHEPRRHHGSDNDGENNEEARAEQNTPRNSPRNDRPKRAPRRRQQNDDDQVGLDLAVLPPAIGITSNGRDNDGDDQEAAPKPARKPRARKIKPTEDNDIATAAE